MKMIAPYTRLCGRFTYIPPYFSIVQIHTEFSSSLRSAQSRQVFFPSQEGPVLKNTVVMNQIESKADAEWLGLQLGLEYAIEQGEHCVALESSGIHTMQGLLIPGTTFYRASIGYRKQKILSFSDRLDWLGARLISSRENRATSRDVGGTCGV
jgi:hypothetical protein